METHDPKHEDLLQALLTEEAAPAAAAMLQTCAQCRERLRELQAAAATLQAMGKEQRAVLAEADALPGSTGQDLIRGLVRAGLRQRRAPRQRGPWPWLALAAALLVGALLWSLRREGEPTPQPPDRTLGQHDYWPSGRAVTELAEKGFEWLGEPGEKFVLSIYDPSDPINPRWEIPCDTNQWLPPRGFVDGMHNERPDWTWQVELVSAPAVGSKTVRVSATVGFSFLP